MQKFPDDILTEIRQYLEGEKKRIASRIAELSLQDPFSDPDRTNDNAASDTEASEESSHDRVAALIAELTKKRDEVDAALTRIKKGTYGFCTSCGSMVDTDRLAVLPTATLCLSCESTRKNK